MEILILASPVILAFLIPVIPGRHKAIYALFLVLITGLITSIPALKIIAGSGETMTYNLKTGWGSLVFTLDGLSAFFILVVNFTMLTGTWFARGYLAFYQRSRSRGQLVLHHFSWIWLQISMLAVLTLREGTAFLIAWELMGVSSFVLILFEAEKRQVLKTAVNYLIQMHVGFILLLAGFLITGAKSDQFGFDGLTTSFASGSGILLFLLFFSGFAVKAGLVPFHTWLPEAHPAAPSHVSGVMSGVMIKMGFYGLFRLVMSLGTHEKPAGIIILAIGIITGLYGIMQSVIQGDLKKMLAFSTIENAGIIAIGIGLGTIGMGTGNHALTMLGFGGSLLHILNHSLFKSLLFFTSGIVYQATHNRNMDQLGGLIHRMPRTAGLFLFGSLAICALPPFNGFISEVMIYYGMFAGLKSGTFFITLVMMIAILALALTGGMAIYGFTRAFGLTFLGSPRNHITGNEPAGLKKMVYPGILILILMLLIGIIPAPIITLIMHLIASMTGIGETSVFRPLIHAFAKISLISTVLLFVIGGFLLIRKRLKIKERTTQGPTWGCGYTAPSPRQQYTASSFSANLQELAEPLLRREVEYNAVHPEELFPADRSFHHLTRDMLTHFVNRLSGISMTILKKLARLQTGHIQHYILYAFLFILFIFILLYLNLI